MIRKLLLSLAAAALLGGCVTAPYGYRTGTGDYYYGQPSVEYRYYGGYSYGSPYPYGYYGPYRYGYGYPYRPGYRYGYPYYGYPYYGHPYRPPYHPPYHHPPRPGHSRPPIGQPTPPPNPEPGYRPPRRDGAPWRNLDELRRRQTANGAGPDRQPAPMNVPLAPARPPAAVAPRPSVAPPRRADSGLGERLRRAQDGGRRGVLEQEP